MIVKVKCSNKQQNCS